MLYILKAYIRTTAKAEHQVERRLLLDIIVAERTLILELLARKDETLLIGRNTLLVLNLLLDILNLVGGLDVERDGLTSEGLDEDLHSILPSVGKL